jgi:hypothetical protein
MILNYSGRYGADGFVSSAQFSGNFARFFDNKSNIYLNVKIAFLVTNPLQNFKFVNCGDVFLENSEWTIQSMKFDLVDETTSLELLKIN